MKKTLVATILGLATAASVLAQGRILLNDSGSTTQPYPYITYGAGSGGSGNISVGDGFTVGFYYSATSATFDDLTGTAVPTSPFTLATGLGSTALINADYPGLFDTPNEFTFPTADATYYMVVVAYNGADYASSTVRGHSAVFSIGPNLATGQGTTIGADPGAGNMQGFQVFSTTVVPEPSTFALAGLGLAGLLIFRRRK